MTDFLTQVLSELWSVFREASPYILLGFAVAAGIQVLLPVSIVQRLFGKGRVRPIVVASLLGIPLPLCSCSVLPTALSLRKRGASRGATLSFLISTPETGVDSIALTYGLMDPLMTVFRPFSALVSALTAGFAAEAFGKDPEPTAETETAAPACDHCEPGETPAPSAHSHGHAHDALEEEEKSSKTTGWTEKLRSGFRGSFVELFDETSHWMFAGLVISALIAVFLPAEIVTRYLSSGPVPLLLMLVIGIPLYICASASTPIAAALILKGLSPGAALVFLLAGPATNIGSLAILSRFLGRRVMVIYITTIAVLSLALGATLDLIYNTLRIDPQVTVGQMKHLPAWLGWGAAFVFAGLLFFSFRRATMPNEFRAVVQGLERLLGFRVTRPRLAGAGLLVALLWVLSTCLVPVPPGQRALVRTFGAPSGGPRTEGLHFKWPAPFGSAELVHVDAVRRVEIGFRSPGEGGEAALTGPDLMRRLEEESVYLTGDENLLATQSVVQYRIVEADRYVYGFDDPELVIKLEAVAEILEVLAGLGIDGVYTNQRPEVESLVTVGLQRRVERLRLGVEVLRFSIRDVHAPAEVHAAFRDVASAQEDKQTAINVAYRYLDETVNLARGEAAREVEVAKSFRAGQVLKAQGESESLALRADAYQERPTGTFTRLYLETIEEALAGSQKIIRPGWNGSGSVDLWISTGEGEPVPMDDVLRGSQVREEKRTRAGE